jgi:UV-endonuclease UvdE
MHQYGAQPHGYLTRPNAIPDAVVRQSPASMIRLGVAVRVLGRDGLRARDARRAEHAPHLSVSLLYLRELLLYLAEQRIGCYRLADDLAPYLDRADLPEFARQIEECAELLAETGALARAHGIRLTMHIGLHVALAAPDEQLAARGAAAIVARARLLDALGTGPESVLTLHVGGAYGDGAAALHRFAARFERLPEFARRRVAVEPDEDCFALPELLRLHQLIGVPVFCLVTFEGHSSFGGEPPLLLSPMRRGYVRISQWMSTHLSPASSIRSVARRLRNSTKPRRASKLRSALAISAVLSAKASGPPL